MKITYLVAVLLSGLAAVGCQQTTQNAAQPSESVVVGIKQSARIGQSVSVQVDTIQDSRCPANAICIRAGNADVSFTLTDGTNRQSGSLCLGECKPGPKDKDSTTVQLGTDRYLVLLSEVRPYPGTDPANTRQEAVIKVKKQ
ncbi:hypothetical protein [Spirosoma fluminis]